MNSIQKERKLNRLKEYDYSKCGYYFVTICIIRGVEYFGKIDNEKMVLNQYGKIAQEYWSEIPNIYDKVEIDEFIIMPNHIHGIIIIQENDNKRTEQCSVPTNTESGYGLLSKVIKSFKNAVTKKNRQELGVNNFQWQRSFYDHVIRNEKSLYEIRKYIINNPLKWDLEKNNIENLPSILCSNSKK
ncbi:MAG: hypothetical protein A2W07_01950 [candidate division Zixibacteria bacterium RBG_16_43_9]|nr:MAG: hypothetical protein A2W07_01950 [candidate division Zixibacteria bacterium RBG_16_43_9]